MSECSVLGISGSAFCVSQSASPLRTLNVEPRVPGLRDYFVALYSTVPCPLLLLRDGSFTFSPLAHVFEFAVPSLGDVPA